jgi:hypothetical protein
MIYSLLRFKLYLPPL